MQFTADTRNATAFELTALAEFVQKLASVAPRQAGLVFTPATELKPVNTDSAIAQTLTEQHLQEIVAGNAPTIGQVQYQALVDSAVPAVGVTAPAAGPAPEIPAVPGAIPQAPAVAQESSNLTAAPAVPTEAPAAPALPNEGAASATQLDKAGCPWDARIHTSNKAVIGDGTWRKKPGVDPAYYEQVKAELMGNAAPSTTPPAVPAAPATEQPAHAPSLTGQDVIQRCMEIQMAHPEKGAALFQAIVAAGVPAGPMGLPSVTDPAVLQAALDAVNAA